MGFFGGQILVRDYIGFCLKLYGFIGVLIFAPIRSSLSLHLKSGDPPPPLPPPGSNIAVAATFFISGNFCFSFVFGYGNMYANKVKTKITI